MAFRPGLKKTISGLLEQDWENMNDLLNAISDAVEEEAKDRVDHGVLCQYGKGGWTVVYGPYPTSAAAQKAAEKIGALTGPSRMWVTGLVTPRHLEVQVAKADEPVRKAGHSK